MKKYAYILLSSLMLLSACSRDEGDLFDKSAAERTAAVQTQLKATLMAADNGWEMLYFPYPDAAGYAFLMKFNEDQSVLIAAKNSISSSSMYKEETSMWGTDNTQGPVLSFNTYNSLFHAFSDPGDDGVGYNGDYEFFIMSSNDSIIKLMGKKHSAYVYMKRLAPDQDWEAYFKTIDSFNDDVFKGNDGIQMQYIDGSDTIYQMTYEDGTFTYTDREGAEQARGFIISPTGLHFYSGCPVGTADNVAQNFVLNAEKDKLVNTSNPDVFFASNYTATEFFAYKFEKQARWIYTEEGTDEATVNAVNTIKDLAKANGAEITRIAYDHYSYKSGMQTIHKYSIYISYLVNNRLYEGRLNCSYANENGELTYTYTDTESTLKPLMQRINSDEAAAAKMFTDIFCDTFTASSYTETKLNMVQLMLHSTTDGNKNIHVIADITK